MLKIYVGYDAREQEEWKTCASSIIRNTSYPVEIYPIKLDEMIDQNLYWRKMITKDGRLWDDISEAPCATEFAISRFLTPHLSGNKGWSIFMDSDMLVRHDIYDMLHNWAPENPKAVYVVKHKHEVTEGETKMDGQLQLMYRRKNWSSVMLFNCDHPANQRLTLEMINTLPGRDLHAFSWLKDGEIGELEPEFNYLVDVTNRADIDPSIVHFTLGTPLMKNYEDCEYSDEWHNENAIRKEWEKAHERI